MIIAKIDSNLAFDANIKINKNMIENKLLKSGGISSVSGGVSTISTGSSSGADMIVHGSESAVPAMQSCSSLFDQFAKAGHKILDILMKNDIPHNAYDASFFSSTLTGFGGYNYYHGMNNIIKGIEKSYNKKIPT